MTCQDVLDRLSPFVDNELDPVASEDVERHLASCPECAAALARHQELGKSLRRELPYHGASDLLRERVMRDLQAAGRPARRIAPSWRWLSAAAAFVAVVGGTWVVARLPLAAGNDVLAREAVSGHIRSLMASHLTDVTSTDQHTVKPWFAGKLDFSPPVTDFAAAGYPLIGGRLDYLEGRPVAALVYLHRKHVINVFVWPATGAREQLAPEMTQQGFHMFRATHAGMSYQVVSDLNTEELAAFTRMLAAPADSTVAP